jgi:hypothetical protein
VCPELVLSNEIVHLVERRMKSTLDGIEETLECVFSTRETSWDELKEAVHELEELQPSFREVEPPNPFHTFPEEHGGIRQLKKKF